MTQIRQRAEEAKEQLRQKLLKEIIAIDSEQIMELRTLMEEATKAADLDSAIEVRDSIRKLEDKVPIEAESQDVSQSSAQRKFVAKLLQSYWVPPQNGRGYAAISSNGFVMRSDGYLMPIDIAGDLKRKSILRWAPVSERSFVVVNDNGYICLFTETSTGILQRVGYGFSSQDTFDTRLQPLPKKKK